MISAGVLRAEALPTPFASVEALDARLAELARGAGRARLVIGELLEALAKRGGHHELGFSSLEAYARERAGRSGRWAVESRTLARRLGELPALRAALGSGSLGWCMTELVARHADPSTEAELVERASTATVREMRAFFAAGQLSASPLGDEGELEGAPDERCTLTLTLSQRDAWLFEWTRRFVEHTGGKLGTDGTVSALLAETFSSLCCELPANDLERCVAESNPDEAREIAWRAQLAAWRLESERRCEENFEARGPGGGELIPLPAIGALSNAGLDARIVRLARDFTAAEVELARTALAFHQSEGARRLGYATEAQYARERLGISHSSFKAKLALARRAVGAIRTALERGKIGHEAALLISRIATPETADAWVRRAHERTAKHLAEDVRAAELVRIVGGPATPPPAETIKKLHELEGRLLAGDREAVLADESQLSALPSRVSLRLRVTRDTARFHRAMSATVRRFLPRGVSFTRLLCERFWEAWKHLCQHEQAYADIYCRDRFTCSSPVCSRHDVTPHHVKFRSQGGTDDDDNVASLCTWCHMEGVHGGRIVVTGKVGELCWDLGPVRVEGRTRVTKAS